MSYETYEDPGGEAPLPEESNNNRTFMIAVGILGGIILLSVACLGAVYVFGSQSRAVAQQTQVANVANATATAAAVGSVMDQALTATEAARQFPTTTSTPLPTATSPIGDVVASPTPTSTPNPAIPPGIGGTAVAQTATIGAAYTKVAASVLTIVPTTTALPNTGFIDDVGLPGLVVMVLAFVIVILLARRLRIAPESNR